MYYLVSKIRERTMQLHINAIQGKIRDKRCPHHSQAPTIHFHDDGIEVSTCCDAFRKQLNPHIDEAMDRAGTRLIIEAIKNFFRPIWKGAGYTAQNT